MVVHSMRKPRPSECCHANAALVCVGVRGSEAIASGLLSCGCSVSLCWCAWLYGDRGGGVQLRH